MKKVINILGSNRGSILVYVLIIFLVLSILTMSILHINMSNIKQSISQQENLQAYYLAYSGIELGYAALMADNESLYKKFQEESNKTESDNVKYGQNNKDDIAITITSSDDMSTIMIISTGTHKKTNRSKTIKMSFTVSQPYLRKWEY